MITLNFSGTTTFPIRLSKVSPFQANTWEFEIKGTGNETIVVQLTDESLYPLIWNKFTFDNEGVQLKTGQYEFTVYSINGEAREPVYDGEFTVVAERNSDEMEGIDQFTYL